MERRTPNSGQRRPSAARLAARLLDVRCALVLTALLLFSAPASAPAQTTRANQIKAAFLYNFAQFTEWPTNAFSSSNAPLVIGVLGTDPFGPILDEIARDEIVRGHQLVVERYQRVEQIKTCHILYISQSEAARLDPVVKYLKGKPMLTVSDIENSAHHGVMIRFLTDTTIHLRINVDALQDAGVTVSSQLLRVSEIVRAPASNQP